MKSLRSAAILAALLFSPALAHTQDVSADRINYGNGAVVRESFGNGAPSGSCSGLAKYTQFDAPTGRSFWLCKNGTWEQQGSSSSSTPTTSSVMDSSGLLGEYHFDETSGNLLDYSGAHNDATVATATAPYRIGANYEFYQNTQIVDFPSALNATNTYYFAVTLRTTPGGSDRYGVTSASVLITNSGSTGLEIFLRPQSSAGPLTTGTSGLPTSSALSYTAGTLGYASTVLTGSIFTGTHVIALSCPSSGNGQFYLDGVLVATTSGSQACYNANTAGNLRFGAGSGNAGVWPQGTLFWGAAFYSTSDNQEVVSRRSGQLRAFALAKGAPFAGTPAAIQRINDLTTAFNSGAYSVTGQIQLLIGAGDSIECGYAIDGKCTSVNVSTSPNAYLSLAAPLLTNTYGVANFSVPSAAVQDTIAAEPVLVDPLLDASFSGTHFVLTNTGTNNFNVANTPAFVWGMQQAYAASVAKHGGRPVLIGLTSRTGSGCSGSQNCDTVMQSMNAVQRTNWKSSKYLAYMDVGSDPLLGATGANANRVPADNQCFYNSTAMYYTDGLHLCGGHTQMAKGLACVLNGVDGTNSSNMGGAIITASTTFTQPGTQGGCADGGRYADPTNGAINLTLFTAMWQTGREIAYCNVSSSSSNALTLTAPADFPFSNVSGRTSVTVAPNTCARFRSTFNGNPASPGNYWMQF